MSQIRSEQSSNNEAEERTPEMPSQFNSDVTHRFLAISWPDRRIMAQMALMDNAEADMLARATRPPD